MRVRDCAMLDVHLEILSAMRKCRCPLMAIGEGRTATTVSRLNTGYGA